MSEAITTVKTTVLDAEYKDINTLTFEINSLYRQTQETMLINAVKIGRKLTQAKELLEHGQWGSWVKENLVFSQDKASDMMKIYENYGSSQENIFGELNSETFRNLGVYQAFALLKVPEEEREEFVKENHVEDLSVRELKKIIAEREAERDTANSERDKLKQDNALLRQVNIELNKKANDGSAEKLKDAEQALKKAQMEKEAAEEATKVAQKNLGAVMEKEKDLLDKYDAATKAAEEAQENPVISEEMLRTLQSEAEAKAKEAAEAAIAKAKAEAQAEAQAEIEELNKKLKAADKDVAVLNGAINGLIAAQEVVVSSFRSAKHGSPESEDKLIKAIQAVTRAFLKKIKA